MHLIYITFPDREKALETASSLVRDRLVACVNLYDGVTSVYEWEGQVQQSSECTLICKTSDGNVEGVIDYIAKLHPYSCPCIVAVKVQAGHDAFLEWVDESCKR
jgi:periplasmic divalent cation tolerance protein